MDSFSEVKKVSVFNVLIYQEINILKQECCFLLEKAKIYSNGLHQACIMIKIALNDEEGNVLNVSEKQLINYLSFYCENENELSPYVIIDRNQYEYVTPITDLHGRKLYQHEKNVTEIKYFVRAIKAGEYKICVKFSPPGFQSSDCPEKKIHIKAIEQESIYDEQVYVTYTNKKLEHELGWTSFSKYLGRSSEHYSGKVQKNIYTMFPRNTHADNTNILSSHKLSFYFKKHPSIIETEEAYDTCVINNTMLNMDRLCDFTREDKQCFNLFGASNVPVWFSAFTKYGSFYLNFWYSADENREIIINDSIILDGNGYTYKCYPYFKDKIEKQEDNGTLTVVNYQIEFPINDEDTKPHRWIGDAPERKAPYFAVASFIDSYGNPGEYEIKLKDEVEYFKKVNFISKVNFSKVALLNNKTLCCANLDNKCNAR
ncbi:hypothetical protein [Symbiopectobacterium purcellii]|uniref:PA14 domain-containing protein n=1 Tax=Symbiopectobacterium purcellii TaxID=2871826 RepID=A0ABX9AMZ0_9ENTR|nr:hypothetical protein [Symbiopectobacterium purcellii]QZN96458.1 hypothetical protein K6K13_03075 [Symbiopectobacterium purcellii]